MHKLFNTQHDDEQILLFEREHLIILFFRIFILVCMTIPLIFFASFAKTLQANFGGDISWYVAFGCLYAMFLLMLFLFIFTLHYLNEYIVTDQRLIDIDQHGILSRTVSELRLDKIEDVTSKSNGLLSMFVDFGDVYIQTAGNVNRFEFNSIPHPSKVVTLILNAQRNLEEHKIL